MTLELGSAGLPACWLEQHLQSRGGARANVGIESTEVSVVQRQVWFVLGSLLKLGGLGSFPYW